MAFLKTKNKCDNCGNDLSDEEVVEDGNHEFCSVDCKEKYEEAHEHEDDAEENVCEFC